MPSPFPGFDPYLENRYYWSTVHAPLLVALQQAIRRRLPRGFIASVEQHLAIEIPSNDFWATGRDAPASRQPDITVFETGYDGAALLAEKYALPLTRPLTEPEVVTQDELVN